MRIRVLAFGKLKTAGLRETGDYYQRLIRPWAPIEEIELKPIALADKSPATRQKAQEKEAEVLLGRLKTGSTAKTGKPLFYLLDETGKDLSTQEWATLAREWEESGFPEVSLCIGSSIGFDESVRRQARGSIRLGRQTMSHELARVVLFEQLERPPRASLS